MWIILAGVMWKMTDEMQAQLAKLPPMKTAVGEQNDWLVRAPKAKSAVYRSPDNKEIWLDNGLVRRAFRCAPNFATVSLHNHRNDSELLRAVKPEATVELNGKTYVVGGLTGQPNLAFLRPEWLDTMQAEPNAFRCTGFEVGQPQARLTWKRTARSPVNLIYPPTGAALTVHFASNDAALKDVEIDVHYELYDGIPLMAKWLTIANRSSKSIRLNHFTSEILGTVEAESLVERTERWELPNLTVVTDYTFGGMSPSDSNRTVHWETDPDYTTQVNYLLQTPCLLQCRPPIGPDVEIAPQSSFASFRTFELLHDTTERERKSLAVRRMYRTLAPWAMENPLMLHLTTTDPAKVKTAIDQAADCGFEMVIFSFGSGLNMEDVSPKNIETFRAYADYAHKKGVQLGGYSLLASRRIDDANDVIDPNTGKTGGAIFGNSPCLGSRWGQEYFAHIRQFLSETGFDLLEHDGSYPGDVCASTSHPGHQGLNDSQWTQFQQIAAFYRWCREQGIYLNVPDWYFLSGSNKTGMGYRETNWSLPRAQQHIHARQHLFDGTWEKTPSMGWMFTPLTQYHGGGDAATLEPLRDHLPDYEQHLANNLGYGAQACYRGGRLYDSEETKAAVIKWVQWFKAHRAILESDVIHWRRADARDMDGIIHVNPNIQEKALAVFYNPTDKAISKDVVLPLYYTGLTHQARVRVAGGRAKTYALDREYQIKVKISIPAGKTTWLTVE